MTPQSWAEKPHSEWTNEDLLACARWWAEELGLSSWLVTAVFEPRYTLDALARCTYNARTETARIRVALWAERDYADPVETELEQDVVHELIHVRFWAVDIMVGGGGRSAEDIQGNMHELAIDRVARALVRQRRRDR